MSDNPSDPMSFLKNLWGNNSFALPGMVAPTLDTDELEKQIRDLKSVEGWLRTNLSMLSMTIQNLEMQRTTLTAVRTMSQMYADRSTPGAASTGSTDGSDASGNLAQAAMWPWNMMQQMQETMQQAAVQAQHHAAAGSAESAAKSSATDNAAQGSTSRRKKST